MSSQRINVWYSDPLVSVIVGLFPFGN